MQSFIQQRDLLGSLHRRRANTYDVGHRVRCGQEGSRVLGRQEQVPIYVTHKNTYYWRLGELVFYAIFQPYLVIYGGQFPQLEEQIISGSEPATFR